MLTSLCFSGGFPKFVVKLRIVGSDNTFCPVDAMTLAMTLFVDSPLLPSFPDTHSNPIIFLTCDYTIDNRNNQLMIVGGTYREVYGIASFKTCMALCIKRGVSLNVRIVIVDLASCRAHRNPKLTASQITTIE